MGVAFGGHFEDSSVEWLERTVGMRLGIADVVVEIEANGLRGNAHGLIPALISRLGSPFERGKP
jgi:hypothetical protein